ncbi:hypothetical protein DCC79_09635 [bacterium]|nr:MAG: hypothetical protein DCC79_09635 [bacterium]
MATRHASRGSVGRSPAVASAPQLPACQLSFSAIAVWPRNSRSRGSGSRPGTPAAARLWLRPRTVTFTGAPCTMNPPIITRSPVPTQPRVEMLASVPAGGGATSFSIAIS